MNRWLNFIGYQAVWLIAVIAAGRGSAAPGVGACALFTGLQLASSTDAVRELRLIAAAIGSGTLLDGALALSGLLHYAAASFAFPSGGAPVWILAIWAAFATTLTSSLAWLRGRPIVAAGLGAVGAPLAYLGAERGWHAVTFEAPAWRGIACLAAGWAVALAWLSSVAGPALPPAAKSVP